MDDRENESQAVQATTILVVCPAIALIFVAMRVYTRFFLTKKYFWEDYMIVIAMVHAVAMSVFMGLAVLNGAGRHIEFVTPAELRGLMRASIGTIHFYTTTHFFLKLSICLQYMRLSVMLSEKRACYLLITMMACGTIAFTIINLARCRPFAAQWDPTIPGARCTVNNTVWFYSNQAFHIAMDFYLLILPFFILRHLTVPLRQKLLIALVLGFGGTACIISVIRLHTLYSSTTSTDPTWDKNSSGYYGQVEVNLGIICASIVTLKPLWQKWRGTYLQGNPQGEHAERPRQRKLPQHSPSLNHLKTSKKNIGTLDDSFDIELGATDSSRSCTDFSRSGSQCTGAEYDDKP